MKRCRILLTGASGFIGSRVALRCAEAGHEVIATSRQPSPELVEALGMPVQPLDVLDPALADLELEADVLIHCATANDIVSKDFAAGVNLSVNGTRNVLEFAVKKGIRQVIFFSTLQVYGTELEGEVTEATVPHCESPYGLNHLLGEEVCRLYANRHGLDVVLVRPANVYGVPDASTVNRATLVPMCFVKTALQEGRLVLMSSGKQQRNFVSTDEVAETCLHLIQSFPQGATVVNAGSQWLASIHEMAVMVADEYRRRFNQELPIEVRSEQPIQGNHFRLQSQYSSSWPSIEESRAQMKRVIAGLYEFFKPDVPN